MTLNGANSVRGGVGGWGAVYGAALQVRRREPDRAFSSLTQLGPSALRSVDGRAGRAGSQRLRA